MYKENKLAELCAQLEEERDGYNKQILELKMYGMIYGDYLRN